MIDILTNKLITSTKNEINQMTTIHTINFGTSVLTVLVVFSQILAVNNRAIAQSIPQISIPGISSPVIPVTIPSVVAPTVNITTTNNIPSTSLKSQPIIPTPITPTLNVTTINNIPSTSLVSQPVIPTVNVITTNNIPSTSLINSPTPVIPTVDVTFNNNGFPSTTDLKPLTFSVTGNENNTEPSFLSVIDNNGMASETTGVGSTNITIPQPTPIDGQLVTVSTGNVVFPSSQPATGITSTATGNSSSFNLQVNFTSPALD
jgi:hypothetical protein